MKKKLILPLLSGLAIVPIAVVSCTDDTNITSRKNQNGQSGNNQQEQPDPSKPNTDGNGSGSNQTTPPPATKPESPKTPETPQPPAKPEDPKTPETPQPPAKPEDPKAPETKPETPEPPAKPQEPEKKVVDKKLVFDTAKKLLKFLNKQKELLTTLTSAEKLKSLSLDSYSKEKEFEELSKLDQEFLKFYAENKYIFESDVALNELKFAPIKTDEWINNALPSVKIAKKLISSVDELKAIKNEYFTKISQIAKDGQARIDSLKQVVGVAKKGYEWLTEGFDLKKENHKDVN